MLETLPVALAVAAALGFLAGLGVGGGSLLMLYLTLVLGMAQQEARLLNLLFFLPSALVATLFRWRRGALDIKKLLPAIVCGCLAAWACSAASTRLDRTVLEKLFGALLLFTGVREVLYKP